MSLQLVRQSRALSLMRITGKIMGSILLIILLAAVIISIYYLIKSPGKMAAYKDETGRQLAGSICQKEYVQLNGHRFGMVIKSKDLNNPVLLFLHGGVGMPEYPLTMKYPSELEEHFTVVWWDQRGAGLSYDSSLTSEDITTKQMIADTIAVSGYLCKRFEQKQIYMMAMSAGTFFGIQAVQQAPWLYKAYIGVSQVADQQAGIPLAYAYMVDYYTKRGEEKSVNKLKACYGTEKYMKIVTPMMLNAGIETMRDMRSYPKDIALPLMDNPEYTLGEKINIWRGFMMSKQSPANYDSNHTNLMQQITKLDVPVYFFAGEYDYIVNAKLAKDFFSQIDAPVKGFYLFKDSAHSPIFEEVDRSIQIMEQDVKQGRNSLADAK